MKKVILSLMAMAMSCSLFAQTNSITSGNMPSGSLEGYTWEFNGTGTDNCDGGNGISYYGGITNQTWSIDGSGHLIVTVPVMTIYDGNTQLAFFYTDNCVGSPIDLSNATNKKIEINLNSPDAGQMVVVMYSGGQSNYAAAANVFDVVVGSNHFSGTLDLTGITNEANITAVGFLFRGAAWGDPDFTGAVSIDNIKIGDVATLSASTNASVDNSLISVYPNPAKDQININLASMSNASVKIMNSNGMLVYEGTSSNSNEIINTSSFNKGIYLVQVSSGDKVSNKKVVIE